MLSVEKSNVLTRWQSFYLNMQVWFGSYCRGYAPGEVRAEDNKSLQSFQVAQFFGYVPCEVAREHQGREVGQVAQLSGDLTTQGELITQGVCNTEVLQVGEVAQGRRDGACQGLFYNKLLQAVQVS